MKEWIYFNTKQLLDTPQFESFLRENGSDHEFVWVTNFYEYLIDNEIVEQKTYISLETSTEGFKYHYAVFDSNHFHQSLRGQIDILKRLAQKLNIEILSTDDEINPWSWVLIEPNGQASSIETNDADVLVVGDFYNFPFGGFRTKTMLTEEELGILKRIISKNYPNIDIHHGFDGPVINGDFNRVKNNFNALRLFDHYYEIVPVGKNEWLDKHEKSELFVGLMSQFQKEVDKDLCLFPSNYSEVQNIEGGSDTEEHCLILSKNKVEKIIYKKRRKSWIA